MNTPVVKLTIGRLLWFGLTRELCRRGRHIRESGAFLLGKNGSRHVTRFVCYDDLDPQCLNKGYIHFDGAGYVPLAQLCQSENLYILADVHTHPASWTDQSIADKSHPMMSRKGHIGLIIPNYSKGNRLNLKGVGAFEYLGDGKWKNCRGGIRLVLP
jgi:hypothetical protein